MSRATWVCLMAIAFLANLAFAQQTGNARPRGPRVEVVCPSDPIPVRIGDHQVLVYELHVTNFDKVPLAISELEVYADARKDHRLLSAAGAELAKMVQSVGSRESTSTKLDPGGRSVIFITIELGSDSMPPERLLHWVTFTSDTSNERSSPISTPAKSILNGFPVIVSREQVPVLAPPFEEGIWVASEGPANESGHRRTLLAIDGRVHAPERFASDWVKVGPNGDSRRGTAKNEDYWAYGQPILSVADGEVTTVVDGIPDNMPGTLPNEISLENIAGNHIVLRIAPNRYVMYAHLQPGSITVAPKQHVVRGTVIGRLGNSGQSTGPHLHLQVTDGGAPLESEGVPFVFIEFVDLGPGAEFELDKHISVPRQNSLPSRDQVVQFKAARR